jgi:hypothetical protein
VIILLLEIVLYTIIQLDIIIMHLEIYSLYNNIDGNNNNAFGNHSLLYIDG